MQDVFVFEQTGVRDGKIEGLLKPTGIRPTFMGKFKTRGIRAAARGVRHPCRGPAATGPGPPGEGDGGRRGGASAGRRVPTARRQRPGGHGRRHGLRLVDGARRSGDRQGRRRAIKEQTRQCLQNLKSRLEAEGSSLEKVVWANWSLRDPAEFDTFNEEWVRWFPGDAPIGQGTLMPPLAAPGRLSHLDRSDRRGAAPGPGVWRDRRLASGTRRRAARPRCGSRSVVG